MSCAPTASCVIFSDSLDAESAARSVLNGQTSALAKAQTGASEMIRHLKIARDSAVKAKSQAMITLKTLIINAPTDLRDTLDQITGKDHTGQTYRSAEAGRHHITDRFGQERDACDCTALVGLT